ncbi:MAG TPA: hypothetical protein VLM05_07225 [Mycobacteriales bacterium]|nr:hypothetical protein [Mycobacteriales bacterium]
MALTVRPDDEVYQFDTVWLGPDEYTLPIQARYVAWGTWLACFLVAAVVLIPLGGNGPAGVLGSLIWSLGLSIVLSRAVMLVVDHERPLRSLPALFSAEARAALAARRRGERSLLVRPGKIRVRETPPKVLAMRERDRARAAAKVARRRKPSTELVVVEPEAAVQEPAWTPDVPVEEWYAEPVPAWSVPTDEDYPVAPVPAWGMPAGEHERYVVKGAPAEPEVHEFVRAPDPESLSPRPTPETPRRDPEPAPRVPAHAAAQAQPGAQARHAAPAQPGDEPVRRSSPFRADPHEPEGAYRGPVTVSPDEGRHAKPAKKDADPHAALEARILLPARKDR